MADDLRSNQAFTSVPQRSFPLSSHGRLLEPCEEYIIPWCLVEGDYNPFKEVIHAKGIDTTKFSLLPKNLVLWKLRESEPLEPDDTFARRVSTKFSNLSRIAIVPGPWKKLSALFPQQPLQDCPHIIIQLPLNTVMHLTVPYAGYHSETIPFLRLNCLVAGDGHNRIFIIKIEASQTVADLKDAIKEKKKPEFDHKSADALELWKVSLPIDNNSQENIDMPSGKLLLPVDELSTVFLEPPSFRHIHIIVQVPAISRLPPMHRSGSDPPVIQPNVSLRRTTVEGLYDILMRKGLIYVRGTPGSGKTTLMNLLHQYILENDPDAFVCVTWSWPPQNLEIPLGQKFDAYLLSIIPDAPRTSPAFLLMDEAQQSFRDAYLWNKFLKGIISYPMASRCRVVVFCSYGSTSTPGTDDEGTPTDLAQAARMTLWPRKAEGVQVRGLLLDRNEFNEVVSQFNKELVIDQGLAQKIFDLTAGHVGAVCELLRLILDKSKTRLRNGEVLTVNTYYEDFSLEYIMSNLAGPFTRGLPKSKELLENPAVSSIFRRLLVSGRVTERGCDKAIQYCHHKGWIYAEEDDRLGSSPYYTFASPLHYAALSWRLQPRNRLPQFKSPYALSLQVLARFKPSQMKLPIHRAGGGSTSPPEAQYQDEYYRCLLAVTCGNVRVSPEFASARGAQVAGRIDFFIPDVKWGIEITRNGDRLKQHDFRFKTGGAYNKWVKDDDMTDYVLLDCRTSIPKTSHPDIPNLYHVVFNNTYTQVCVLNNKKDRVWGPKALQENHDENNNDHTKLL